MSEAMPIGGSMRVPIIGIAGAPATRPVRPLNPILQKALDTVRGEAVVNR
jgi:hypothetical protein